MDTRDGERIEIDMLFVELAIGIETRDLLWSTFEFNIGAEGSLEMTILRDQLMSALEITVSQSIRPNGRVVEFNRA